MKQQTRSSILLQCRSALEVLFLAVLAISAAPRIALAQPIPVLAQTAPVQAQTAPIAAQATADKPSASASDPAGSYWSYHQRPDQDGIYFVGPEVTAPVLKMVAAANYPNAQEIGKDNVQGFTVYAAVVDPAGRPQHMQLLHSHGPEFDRTALGAIRVCRFEPARLAGKPVPVWIDLRVVFHSNRSPATPQIVIAERDLPVADMTKLLEKHHGTIPYTAPIPIHTVDASFADPFVAHPWVQVAVVDVLVDLQGLPKQVRVVRGLGFGHDEKATAAVSRYRFLPATNHGKPIEARRSIEVPFAEF